MFISYDPTSGPTSKHPRYIHPYHQAANAETFTSNISGTLHLDLPTDRNGSTKSIPLQNTLLCPNTPNTSVSLGKLDDTGYAIKIGNGNMTIYNKQGELIRKIPKTN